MHEKPDLSKLAEAARLDSAMEHSDDIVDIYLEHYGVKGMKWGVVNEDKLKGRDSGKKQPSGKTTPSSDKLTPRDHAILKKAGLSTADAAAMKSKYGPGSLSDDPPSAESRLTPKQKKILIGVAVGVGVGAAAWYLHGKVQVPNDDFLDNFDLDKAASLQIKAEVAAKKSYFKSVAEAKAKANSAVKTHFQQVFEEYQTSHTSRFTNGYSKEYVDGLATEPINLKAGSIFRRISMDREAGIKPKGFYACHTDEDVARYKAILPIYWKQWGRPADAGYVVRLKANVDIKAPSQKDTFKIFRNMLDDEIDVPMLGQVRRMRIRDIWYWNDSQGDLDAMARHVFPQAALNWNDDTNVVTKHFFSILKAQGYNAVIDMNDADALAKTPMRLLDGSMFSIDGHDVLSKTDIERAQELIEAIRHALQMLGRIFTQQGDFMSQQQETEEFLAHYGVKGMKWGVQKARTGNLGTRAARSKRYAEGTDQKGTRRLIDTASAISNYRINDLASGRGLHTAAARRAKVYEAERTRLATGKATTTDILKAYGQTAFTMLFPLGIPAEAARLAATRRDSQKTNDNNRKA